MISFIEIIGFASFVLLLGLAGVSYADLPKVIGNWEDSNDGWEVHPEAEAGTTMSPYRGNATLGAYSLKVFAQANWQKAIIRDLTGDENLLKDLGNATKIKLDVTLKAKEWAIGGGWVKPIENIVLSDDRNGWQQLSPDGNEADHVWNGAADKTFTVTFTVTESPSSALTQGKIAIITSYGNVTTAGNFYFDNVRLIGAAGETKPAEAKKAIEPNKPAEPKKPKEPNKPASPEK